MKNLFTLCASVALLFFAGSCSDDEPNLGGSLPPKIEEVSGIAENYELGLHEYLKIAPQIKIDNDNTDALTYEWSVDNKVVANEKDLSFKCDKLGEFNGYFKVESELGAIIKEFKLRVSSPYDRGLLLLSETEQGSLLTFKRLDKMATPASPLAFKDNNPTLELGKQALSLAWMGSALTNNGTATNPDTDLDIFLSTGNPTTVYRMNPNTLEVKTPITYDGQGTFQPSEILIPMGFQNTLWQGAAYFLGNGKEYILTAENTFVEADENSALPDASAQLADMACTVHNDMDMLRVYFNTNSHKLVLMAGAMFSAEGATVLDGDLMALQACNGTFREETDYRYEPVGIAAVTNRGEQVKVYIFGTDANWDTFSVVDVLNAEIDATGQILPTSAIGVNPIKPLLYYSKGGDIYRLNYDGGNFDTTPYISLGENYEVKQIVFNQFSFDEIYIAAEDKNATGDKKASLFVYDIKDNASAKELFREDGVGGTVKKLIYKGNGKEYENYAAQQGVKSLFR